VFDITWLPALPDKKKIRPAPGPQNHKDSGYEAGQTEYSKASQTISYIAPSRNHSPGPHQGSAERLLHHSPRLGCPPLEFIAPQSGNKSPQRDADHLKGSPIQVAFVCAGK